MSKGIAEYTPPLRLIIRISEGEDNIRREYPDIPVTQFGPNQICEVFDPTTNIVWGYVAIDKLIRGDTSIGGCRLKEDLSVREVVSLAGDMTMKNAGSRLGVTGGKSGVKTNPDYFKMREGETEDSTDYKKRKEEKKDLMEKYAEAIAYLPSYTIAPDMGTDGTDMLNIYRWFEKIFGKNHSRGGTGREGGLDIDGWGSTAYGLLHAAQAIEKFFDWLHIEGARVVINGFGNVGGMAAKIFTEKGAKIIAVNDYHGVLHNKNGLDVNGLFSVIKHKDGIMAYEGEAIRYDARESEGKERENILGELFKIPCDILIPAAVRDVIHEKNYKDIDAKIIIPGANGPVAPEIENKLYDEKGIITLTDWIVNAGGVIAAYIEYEMDRNKSYAEIVTKADGTGREYVNDRIGNTISENVTEIADRIASSRKRGDSLYFRDAAVELAEGNLISPARIKDVRL
ncbi:Glu/Leu/Phe/Val dehydrogenase [candidate division KSB1 bacterium]